MSRAFGQIHQLRQGQVRPWLGFFTRPGAPTGLAALSAVESIRRVCSVKYAALRMLRGYNSGMAWLQTGDDLGFQG